MLSILIPTYNYKVVHLVTELNRQASEQFIDFEIIVMEDGSTLFVEENDMIKEMKSCRHIILENNKGRSAIRNKLADEAKYDYLLFLDCDSEAGNENFIHKYLAFCKEECVVMGGRIYDENETDPDKTLIITYGKKRERYNSPNMSKNKYKMFMTPNFLISKSIFNKVRFDETITGYGHEDTIFGIDLQSKNIDFLMIDNPVIHNGLENNDTYIKKNEFALDNLYRIYVNGRYPDIATKSKVLSLFLKLKKYKLQNIIRLIFKLTKPLLIRNLKGIHPNLNLFDFYKLGYLCSMANKK